MPHDLQLPTYMCEFELIDGQQYNEADYPKGWSEFPYKDQVAAVKLKDRIIAPKFTLNIARSSIMGFAIHWIGRTILGGESNPYMAREIMMVFPNLKAFVFNYNIKSDRWHDYSVNLNTPEAPHLVNYDLRKHGMG